jgi:dephospho-CoA kinase
VGVLGGIASGKSEVARLLAGDDGVLLDADRTAHAALASPEVAALVAEHFGPECLDAEGRPDRRALGPLVFADPERRKLLEGWIHPRVRATLGSELERALAEGRPIVVLDVPLLLENAAESGLAERCHGLVFVDAPAEQRAARAAERRGWGPGELAAREALQLPLEEKRARATWVLSNGGDFASLQLAARALRQRLLAGGAPPRA